MERRFSFDGVAKLYDAARPSYPDALFDDCISEASLKPDERILEVGSGTGKATEAFARKGFPITALEPGPQMIATAEKALARFSNVRFVETTFEAWDPREETFGLVAAAQAWHWVDPAIGFAKAARVLRQAGALAIFGNVPVDLPENLQGAFAQIRQRYFPGSDYSVSGATAAYLPAGPFKEMFDGSGLFGPVRHRAYAWRWGHTTASFLDNQRTLSDFRMMAPDLRERFLADIGAAIDAQGGAFEMDWEAHLYIARKKD